MSIILQKIAMRAPRISRARVLTESVARFTHPRLRPFQKARLMTKQGADRFIEENDEAEFPPSYLEQQCSLFSARFSLVITEKYDKI